jgi:hypothetical protein
MQQTLNCDDEKGIVEENQQNSEAGQTNGLETQDVSDKVYYHFMFFFCLKKIQIACLVDSFIRGGDTI